MSSVSSVSVSSSLSHPNYFPEFSRETTEYHLLHRPSGSFLVRPSSHAGRFVVSVVQKNRVLHLLIDHKQPNGWALEGSAWNSHQLGRSVFSTLDELLAALRGSNYIGIGVTRRDIFPESRSSHPNQQTDKEEKALSASPASHASPSSLSSLSSSSLLSHSFVSHAPAIRPQDYSGLQTHSASPPSSNSFLSSSVNSSAFDSPGSSSSSNISSSSAPSFLEFEYRGMLAALLNSRELTANDVALLAEWRIKNNFTGAQHQRVLEALGLSVAQFEAKCQSALEKALANASADTAPNAPPSTSAASQDCVVCLCEPRSCCFLPCGHVSTCFDCASRLTECPICRGKIEKRQKVYL